jgi:malonyl-CoA O-methyltransferase
MVSETPHTPRDFARLQAAFTHKKRRVLPFLAQLVAERLAERLAVMKPDIERIAVIGVGHGEAREHLRKRYPKAELVEISLNPALAPKQGFAARLFSKQAVALPLRAYGELPLQSKSVDMIWCNLANVCAQHPSALEEWQRVLKVGGFALFSALGPDTARQLIAGYSTQGVRVDLRELVDMHDWGDSLVHAGFSDPVMEMDTLALTYSSADKALAEFAALVPSRPITRGLRGRGALDAHKAALAARSEQGAIALSLELVFGHAFKVRESARGETAVSLESLKASLPSRKAKA